MFYFEDILGRGYQAHVLLYRSENRALDARQALSVGDAEADSSAVLINDLVGGDISGQAHATYNSNLAVSLIQTLDVGAETIAEDLDTMLQQVALAETGVYSNLEVAQFQINIEDKIDHLNSTACASQFRGQKLLCTEEQDVRVYLEAGYSVEIPSADLQFSEAGINIQENPTQARSLVEAAQAKVKTYRQTLADELERLDNQINLADTTTAQTMGYGLNEANDSVAQALAQEVVTEILSESVVALQSQANISGTRAAWLFNKTLKSPNSL